MTYFSKNGPNNFSLRKPANSSPFLKNTILFKNSRSALCYALADKEVKHVLLPVFICESVLFPLKKLNIKFTFYEVKEDLSPNYDDAKKKIKEEGAIDSFLLVHFFGFAQDIGKARQFVKENNLFFIEDNAHGLGATYGQEPLGSNGDIGFSSAHKNLPLEEGSVLWLKEPSSLTKGITSQKTLINKTSFLTKLKNYLKGFSFLRKTFLKCPPYNMQEPFREKNPDITLTLYAEKEIQSLDLSLNCKRRRDIALVWKKWCQKNNLTPLYNSPQKGDCPWIFPVIVKNREERDKIIRWGWINGIEISTWPTFPENIDVESNAFKLWEKLIYLPINSTYSIEKLSQKLNNISLEVSS